MRTAGRRQAAGKHASRRTRAAVTGVLAMLAGLVTAGTTASVATATTLPTGLVAISAGGASAATPASHTCAITSTGGAQCWGANSHGQLGNGTTAQSTAPVNVTGLSANVLGIAAGGSHTCAIQDDGVTLTQGKVWCWGLNSHAELGNGGSDPGTGALTPIAVITNKQTQAQLTAKAISAGSEHTCAISVNNGALCWGRNDSGQVGDGTGTTNFPDSGFTPRAVVGLTSGVTQIVAAGKFSCALVNGGVKCWGTDANGQLGHGGTTDGPPGCTNCEPAPVDVTGLTSGVTAIAAGGAHACALLSDGTVECWGSNSNGQLGVDPASTPSSNVPVAVAGLSNVTSIAAGGNETCAVLSTNGAKCWGQNNVGQLGNGATTPASSFAPLDIPTGSQPVSSIEVGFQHACVIMQAGVSGCWGYNSTGQLGDGSTIDRYNPFLPGAPSGVSAVTGDTKILLSWNAPDDGGFAITQYTVTVTPAGGSPLSPIVVAPPPPTSVAPLTVPGLTNGTTYTVTVVATNAIGDGHASTPVTVVPAGIPGAPTGLTVTALDGAATVSWSPAATNGAPIISYQVTVTPGNQTINVSGARNNATVGNLTNGSSYTFKTTAKNKVGPGPSASVSKTLPIPKSGYWMLGVDGNVYPFGNSQNLGRASYPSWSTGLHAVALKPLTDGSGYWIVDNAGGVHGFGAAHVYGQHPALAAGEQVSTMSATATGKGYWLFTNRGRAFPYGDAQFYGDMSHVALNGPVIASVATASGHGYYMVGSDGGVFSFGDARFHGSTGGMRLNQPVVGLSPTPSGTGYWLVATDGGVFAFGGAPFRGSMGSTRLNKPVNGLVPFGNGYLMVASDGGIFNFSNKPFFGSLGSHPPAAPVVGVAAFTH